MHPSYSGWLRINSYTRIATRMTHRFIWVSSHLVTYPGKMQSVWWNVVSRRSGAGWSTTGLLLNDDNTEFIIIGIRQQLNKLQAMNIKVGSSEIKPSCQVKNLNMRHHITNLGKAGFFYLHNIKKVSLRDSLLTLVHAFITSTFIDYCNAYLYGLPKEQI